MGRNAVVGSRSAGIQTRASWRPRTNAQGGKVGAGGDAIQLGTDVGALAEAEVLRTAGVVADVVGGGMAKLAKSAEAGWPVDSGFSRGQLGLNFFQMEDQLLSRLTNSANYAFYIRQPWHRTPHVATRLVFGPAQQLTDEMVDRLALELGD